MALTKVKLQNLFFGESITDAEGSELWLVAPCCIPELHIRVILTETQSGKLSYRIYKDLKIVKEVITLEEVKRFLKIMQKGEANARLG
jgi:hypothetical protein